MKDITTQGVPRLGAIVAFIVGRLVELAANGNEAKFLGDKNDDGADNGNDEDGDDDDNEDKKKNKRNDHNVKRRKDKDTKPSEGDKSKAAKGDKKESKPREGDKNKPAKGDKSNFRPTPVDGDKTKLQVDEGKYEKSKFDAFWYGIYRCSDFMLLAERRISPGAEEADDSSEFCICWAVQGGG
ncbi:hypothetical protein C0993_006205 [Termitomyces sp. T159_Od127]|nr:hypothetical protein C0993_006205 [Termitomyces sp. T159_Od127]